jgi:hypothetical protein
MRATTEIDEDLFREAKRLTSAKTKKELIRRKRVEHLLGLWGTSPITSTLDELDGSREDEH